MLNNMSAVVWNNIRAFHEMNREEFEQWIAEKGNDNQTEAAICRAVLDNDPHSAIAFYAQRRCFELRAAKNKNYDDAALFQQSLGLAKRMTRKTG